MKWITGERAKIDAIACPWLIKNFVDKDAEFIYVPKEQVFDKAKEPEAISYGIFGGEYYHYGEECSFDYFIKKYQINDKTVKQLAIIVRGADTDRFELSLQSADLWAISAGISHNHTDDLEIFSIGMKVYNAFYSWAKYMQRKSITGILS
jgi:hypothetical protein